MRCLYSLTTPFAEMLRAEAIQEGAQGVGINLEEVPEAWRRLRPHPSIYTPYNLCGLRHDLISYILRRNAGDEGPDDQLHGER